MRTFRVGVIPVLVLAGASIMLLTAQTGVPTRKPSPMSFYREARGLDADIEATKASLLTFTEHYDEVMKKKDAASVSAGMSDVWAYSNERGQTYAKEQWIAERMDPNKKKDLIFPYFQHVDIEWHVFGDDTVVETGRSNSTLSYKGKVSRGPRRETGVYTKVNGKWVQASLHVGFIPEEQRDFTFPSGSLPEGVTTADPNTEPVRRKLAMQGYQEATGINPHIWEVKQELEKASAVYDQDMKNADIATTLADMSDVWAYSNERGQTYSRDQWVAERKDPNAKKNLAFPFAEHVDIIWHIFGDNTMVETGRSNSTLFYKGKISHGPRRETSVFTKVNGKWVHASLHVGFIPLENHDFTFPSESLPK
jgi:hypothetical protein